MDRILYLIRRDGVSVPVDITLSPLLLDGRTYTVAYVHNITFRIENERRLSLYKHDDSRVRVLFHQQHSLLSAIGVKDIQSPVIKDKVLHQHACDVMHNNFVIDHDDLPGIIQRFLGGILADLTEMFGPRFE